ncbi:MAG: integrase core domain-containing protein, partial [Nitrososphaera sp.]
PVPHPENPREVVQMDTIDFGGLFAFTAIDCFSREADILVTPELDSGYGYIFLKRSMDRRFDGHVELIQTDGGSEFKDKFSDHVEEYCNRHRISRPYKKNEQSFIESFNRTVRKECLGWINYNPDQLVNATQMIESFLDRYHYHRPHMGLGMRPPLTR